jgi:hypothetical protein
MIPAQIIPRWLAEVNIDKVKLELREKIRLYQLEVVKVLREHFIYDWSFRPR